MDKITTALLSRIKAPVGDLNRRAISMLLDDSGNILDFTRQEYEHFYGISRQLEKVKCIRPFFNLEDDISLSALMQERTILSGYTDKFNVAENLDAFYTTLPVVILRMFPVGTDRILGILSLSDILPKIFEKSTGCLLYLDKSDRITAFSQGFYELFEGQYKKPEDLLNRPVAECLTPTPLQIQDRYLSEKKQPDTKDFIKILEKDFPEGFIWQKGDQTEDFMPLVEAIDLSRSDVMVKIEISADTGALPFLVLGDKRSYWHDYDYNGYRLGLGADTACYMVKKCGFIMASAVADKALSLTGTFTFCRLGNAFLILRENKRVFGYFDYDFLKRKETLVGLHLRPGCKVKLKKITVYSRGIKEFLDTRDLVVKVKKRSSFYLLTRFTSFYITTKGGDLAGYRLQDITEFQSRVSMLEAQYEQQVKEGKRMKSLLEKYQKERVAFIGAGKNMAGLREQAERIAGTASTVLIQGPTGTGKEVLANYIHQKSSFSNGPFLKVDCSVLPKTLMESQLFGHEKGAFTGAHDRNIGLFERAEKGTLFLDEVGNLTMETQAKLLQFLQDFTITRVGGSKPIKLNIRLIAASNTDLKQMALEGTFREDLYYRIAVVPMTMPLLSERLEDLPELCQHFLLLFNRANRKNIQAISAPAYKKMYNYSWPGNIRELKNVIERAVIFCDAKEIGEEHIILPEQGQAAFDRADGPVGRKTKTPVNISKTRAEALLREHQGVVTRVAAVLNVTPRALYFFFKKTGIHPNRFRKNPHR